MKNNYKHFDTSAVYTAIYSVCILTVIMVFSATCILKKNILDQKYVTETPVLSFRKPRINWLCPPKHFPLLIYPPRAV